MVIHGHQQQTAQPHPVRIHGRLVITTLFVVALVACLFAPAFPPQAQAATRQHNEEVPELSQLTDPSEYFEKGSEETLDKVREIQTPNLRSNRYSHRTASDDADSKDPVETTISIAIGISQLLALFTGAWLVIYLFGRLKDIFTEWLSRRSS